MSPRLLLVEDDADLLQEIADSLREEGYAVDAVADGLTALEHIERDPPALLLLDLMMPGMDGYTLMAELYRRNLREKFRVILLSAAARASDSAAWVRADAFIEKPFDRKALVDSVRALVGAP